MTVDAATVDMTSMMTEMKDKQDKEIEKSKGSNKVYSNNTIGDMMSISSSKVKSNNIKDFIKYVNDLDYLFMLLFFVSFVTCQFCRLHR